MVMNCKNEVLIGFVGSFSELLIQFVQFKQSLGYKYIADGEMLQRFSKFSLNYTIKDNVLTKELVDAWTESNSYSRTNGIVFAKSNPQFSVKVAH